MNSRSKLIKEIAQYGSRYLQAKEAIQKFPWDCDDELYHLTRKDVLAIFERFLNGSIASKELVSWASFLEMRDDLGFCKPAEEVLRNVVFLIANPSINYEVNIELINRLKKNVWEKT